MLRSRQKSARNSHHVRNRVLETYSNTFFPLVADGNGFVTLFLVNCVAGLKVEKQPKKAFCVMNVKFAK